MIDKGSSGISAGTESEGQMIRRVGLHKILREDYYVHKRYLGWTRPGLHAIWVHRIGVYGKTMKRPWRSLIAIFYGLGHLICRNVYGIELTRTVQIGRRTWIAHQHGIVLHKDARFGDDCMIRQGVTLGYGNEVINGEGPVVGNNVEFGVGAVIVGNVRIGNNVQIGPNCVVMTDVPDNRSLFVTPPRALPRQTTDLIAEDNTTPAPANSSDPINRTPKEQESGH